jgi:hypothetical protein
LRERATLSSLSPVRLATLARVVQCNQCTIQTHYTQYGVLVNSIFIIATSIVFAYPITLTKVKTGGGCRL